MPSPDLESWTDYTKYALGVEDRFEKEPSVDSGEPEKIRGVFEDRRRSIGIDFGPGFTGLALSLGGVNTVPLGTLRTGRDWKETALKIVQIISTRRVQDIVVGMPYNADGSEGRIGRYVRGFTKILADATLLVLGPNITIYLWDERFSTVYAAMRLVTRPRFDGMAFKNWLDGQRGLSFNAKALLDAEAARTILEHWLSKDPNTNKLNKERSERVAPSKEAAMAYLKWKKRPARLQRPKEPAGEGKEGWEWGDLHPEQEEVDAEEYMRRREDFDFYMGGMDNFGDRALDSSKRRQRLRQEADRSKRSVEAQEENEGMRAAFKSAMETRAARTQIRTGPFGSQ